MALHKLPGTTEILGNRAFWKESVFWQFVERVNETTFANPALGLEKALRAVELVERVAPKSERPARLFMIAHALVGSAHRATGNHRDADSAFHKARQYADTLTNLESVELLLRIANLRRCQREHDAALELVNEAIATYRKEGDLTDTHFLGRCYLTRGNIHCERGKRDLALVDYTRTLSHIDPKRGERHHYSAVHNIIVTQKGCGSPEALGRALRELKRARKAQAYKGHTMARYRVRWLEGQISQRFGATRQAERCFLTAQEGFASLGAVAEVALVCLDRAFLYLEEARTIDELRSLGVDTLEALERLSAEPDLLSALLWWKDAEDFSPERFHEAQARILGLTPAIAPCG